MAILNVFKNINSTAPEIQMLTNVVAKILGVM